MVIPDTTLVIDASMTLTWVFEDEQTDHCLSFLNHVQEYGAIVPSLWRLEVANSLKTAIRRGRITPEHRNNFFGNLSVLPIYLDTETDLYAWGDTVRLADEHGLTVYDAAYLELAHRRGLPLATLDQDLAQAARSIGVVTMG